jgi:hypothetical protein
MKDRVHIEMAASLARMARFGAPFIQGDEGSQKSGVQTKKRRMRGMWRGCMAHKNWLWKTESTFREIASPVSTLRSSRATRAHRNRAFRPKRGGWGGCGGDAWLTRIGCGRRNPRFAR